MSEQQLRNLNEQWVVKEDDGKFHMYKAVEGENCKGCTFGKMCSGSGLINVHVCDREDDCPLKFADTVIKDMGVISEDSGCLPASWGEYPTISVPSYEKEPWCVYAYLRRKEVVIKQEKAWGDTEQEAVDNWNKR